MTLEPPEILSNQEISYKYKEMTLVDLVVKSSLLQQRRHPLVKQACIFNLSLGVFSISKLSIPHVVILGQNWERCGEYEESSGISHCKRAKVFRGIFAVSDLALSW